MESKGNSSLSSYRNSNKKIATKPDAKSSASSPCAIKPNGKAVASSEGVMESIGKSDASSAVTMKPTGKAAVSSANDDEVMVFTDVSLGPHEAELRFRLIHFWEARNPNTKTLIGQEMLLIDEQGTVIQGFIPAGRVESYLPHMIAGSVYRLNKFFGSRSKVIFRVADPSVTVTFSWNSVLSVLENSPVQFPEDRFRFHSHDEFKANCDLKGDLYDYVGHMKLVNGHTITEGLSLGEGDIAKSRHLLVHVQTKDGPVIKLYLWDKAATDFCQKFKTYGSTPKVLLVTTVNPKRLGGTLALASMSSSRVFMDNDVQPTKDYLSWLGSNLDLANKINAEVVTKPEKVTIAELFSYIKQENAKVAWFECTATIDDVFHGSAWYYISCGGCNTKATKGQKSLICNNKKCENTEVLGVAQYLTRISVYDQSEQAVFVLLGDAGRELTGKHASELVASYCEANENIGADQLVPVPNALVDTIGQTHNFIVKISEHNLKGKTQAMTVTKVLPTEATQPLANCEEDSIATTTDDILESENEEYTPSIGFGDSTDGKIRKASDSIESEEAKRPKSG